jgi:hypothetical protein
MTDYYYDYNWRRIGLVVGVAVVIGLLVWLLFIKGDDDESSGGLPGKVVATEVQPFGPASAGGDDLKNAATQVGHPIYWAGRHQDGDVELTLTADGRAFVRYLIGGAQPGDENANFLTVGTYQVDNAAEAIQEVAGREGRESFDVPGGGVAVADAAEPTRVYFSPAGTDLQVEVFDPEAGRARELVESGQIQPIG